MERWDSIIVGAGPAGLTAGIYGARSGLRTLILEEKVAGGVAAESPLIENYPGFPSVSGRELADKMLEHCRKFGVEIHEMEGVVELELGGKPKIARTGKTSYEAPAVIIASGCHHAELGVPGEKEFLGRGVSYCAVCDGHLFRRKKVLVIGGGNSAAESALYLSDLASGVRLVHRKDRLRAEDAIVEDLREKKIDLVLNTELKRITGDTNVERAVLFNNATGRTEEVGVDGVFILVGEVPNSEIAKRAGVKTDGFGYILTDERQRTNLEGVYAAGDVTACPVKQVGTAVGQAIVAAIDAYGYVKRPYFYKN